jgi:formylglycine-generating enzyme required for sulfatase activity
MRRIVLVVPALMAAGCWNKPVDVGIGASGLGAKPTGTMEQSAAASVATYAILNLATGKVTTANAVPGLASEPYRTTSMVFKAVEDGVGTRGSPPGQFGAQSDEAVGAISVTRYYLGVFEVTQAQWRQLAGTSPWTAIAPSSLATVDGQAPAVGMSRSEVQQAIAGAGARFGHTLSLPSADQWEYACRAGSTAPFSWGEARDDATVAAHALTVEVLDGSSGARTVGTRQPNLFGFYDMHGNVWEMTSDGGMRGGSWRDSLAQSRSANRGPSLDAASGHALVGIRLVLVP